MRTAHTILALATLTVLVVTAHAQQPSEAEIRQMLEQAQKQGYPAGAMDPQALGAMQANAMKMQACMQNIDQSALESLQAEGETLGRDIRGLCESGQRDAANAKAMTWSKRIAASPEMAQIRKCGDMMKGMLPAMLAMTEQAANDGPSHVCDSPGLE